VRLGAGSSSCVAGSSGSGFALRLGGVAWAGQPLQIVELVVVAGDDVVALGADAVTARGVLEGFAAAGGAALDFGAQLRPVGR
jgi:hypothetical protein